MDKSLLVLVFENIWPIILIYVGIILFFSLLFSRTKRREIIVIGLLNYQGLLGLSVMILLPFIIPIEIEYDSLLLGIFIELFCTMVFIFSSFKIIWFLRNKAKPINDRKLAALILLKLLFFGINYVGSNGRYGIFSESSRIDHLLALPILSRSFYLELIIDFGILASLFLKINVMKRIGIYDLCIIFLMALFNFLTGSKGQIFIYMTSLGLLTYAAFPNFLSDMSKKLLPLIFFCSLIIIGYLYISSVLHEVTIAQETSLIFARFLLSADARIMAFDPNVNSYVLSQPHGTLLSELFRGPARLLGFSTAEFPIGIYQYQYQAGVTNYQGSTNQLAAMFVIYREDFWFLVFALLSVMVFFVFKLFSCLIKSNVPGIAWISAASLFNLSVTLSGGFDAFVQSVPIFLIIVLLFFINNRFTENLKLKRS